MPELYQPIRIDHLDNYRLNDFIGALEDVLDLGRWRTNPPHRVHVIVRGCCTSVEDGTFYDFSSPGRTVEAGGGHDVSICTIPGDMSSIISAVPTNTNANGEQVWDQVIFSVVEVE